MLKIIKAWILAPLRDDCQIRNKEMPMSVYNAVHTGANTKFGGLNDGLFSATYQSESPLLVAIPETLPTATGMIIQIIKTARFFIFIINWLNRLTIICFGIYNNFFKIHYK